MGITWTSLLGVAVFPAFGLFVLAAFPGAPAVAACAGLEDLSFTAGLAAFAEGPVVRLFLAGLRAAGAGFVLAAFADALSVFTGFTAGFGGSGLRDLLALGAVAGFLLMAGAVVAFPLAGLPFVPGFFILYSDCLYPAKKNKFLNCPFKKENFHFELLMHDIKQYFRRMP
ncbi:MAG TPA: hypothetical protein PKL70_09150 [Saprospiraceae bacterium]|nr:hypothetical protein [Saprospiraceae bacterium]